MALGFPEGYVDREFGELRIVAHRSYLEEMKRLLGASARAVPADDRLGGRGGTRRLVLGDRALYLRRCLRGGMVRFLTRDLYIERPPRPLRELVVTEAARSAGCRVPRVVAAAVERHGPFYRGWVVSEEIAGSEPWYPRFAAAAAAQRRELLEAAARALLSLVRAGVYHADLNATNLLAVADGEVAVVDFDRAALASPSNPRRARAGRERLWRSVAKLEARRGRFELGRERAWFDRAYGL